MDKYELFKQECETEIEDIANDGELNTLTRDWMNSANKQKYSYHFEWCGRPIIQYPQDMIAMQEIIWKVQPDLIIETGVAHGGSLIFYASLMEMMESMGITSGGRIVGIDIDIRAHNRAAIEEHPLFKRIDLIEGSSIDTTTVDLVKLKIRDAKTILVILDSNHTHDHVMAELGLYQSFVSDGSYLVVFDTVIELMEESMFPDRPWAVGNNPMTAVHKFLNSNKDFEIDSQMHNKLQITVAPNGFLKCKRHK